MSLLTQRLPSVQLKPLDIRWTSHLDPQDKPKFQEQLILDTAILGRLKRILEEEQERLDKRDLSTKQFENPNWAFEQAFQNGNRAGLYFTLTLLNFLNQKE